MSEIILGFVSGEGSIEKSVQAEEVEGNEASRSVDESITSA